MLYTGYIIYFKNSDSTRVIKWGNNVTSVHHNHWHHSNPDPPKNCHLTVKKLPKTWHFFKKNCPKFSFFSTKLPLAILLRVNGNFPEGQVFTVQLNLTKLKGYDLSFFKLPMSWNCRSGVSFINYPWKKKKISRVICWLFSEVCLSDCSSGSFLPYSSALVFIFWHRRHCDNVTLILNFSTRDCHSRIGLYNHSRKCAFVPATPPDLTDSIGPLSYHSCPYCRVTFNGQTGLFSISLFHKGSRVFNSFLASW